MSEQANQTLLKLGPAARVLGVPQAWLRREADAGRVPHIKAGARLVFNVEAVRRVLLARAAEFDPEVVSNEQA